LGGDGDLTANWIELRTLDGGRVGVFLEIMAVQDYVGRRPGRKHRTISWVAGRVEGRFLVESTWSRRVRWLRRISLKV
jgi:hypothetical protein